MNSKNTFHAIITEDGLNEIAHESLEGNLLPIGAILLEFECGDPLAAEQIVSTCIATMDNPKRAVILMDHLLVEHRARMNFARIRGDEGFVDLNEAARGVLSQKFSQT